MTPSSSTVDRGATGLAVYLNTGAAPSLSFAASSSSCATVPLTSSGASCSTLAKNWAITWHVPSQRLSRCAFCSSLTPPSPPLNTRTRSSLAQFHADWYLRSFLASKAGWIPFQNASSNSSPHRCSRAASASRTSSNSSSCARLAASPPAIPSCADSSSYCRRR